jgi:tetratricopeptide (TPR) repeat protein
LFAADARYQALTRLTRFAQRSGCGREILADALANRMDGLSAPALEVAVQTGHPIGRILAQHLQTTSPELAEGLVELFELQRYGDSVPLWEAALTATRRLLEIRRSEWSRPNLEQKTKLARWTQRLGLRLHLSGRHEEAVQVSKDAVRALRRLAAEDPERNRHLLGAALGSLGVQLKSMGRFEAALASLEEAVLILRQLSASTDATHLGPLLIAGLTNLANLLREMGRFEVSAAIASEASDIFARMSSVLDPEVYDSRLVRSLDNAAATSGVLGRHEEATRLALRALELHQELAAARPDIFQEDLARSLDNLGQQYMDLGVFGKATEVTRQVVEIWRPLARERPDAFSRDLARSLGNLGNQLVACGRLNEALTASQGEVDSAASWSGKGPAHPPCIWHALWPT